MTGLDLAEAADVPVIIGESNCFDWWHRVIVLTPEVATGRDPRSLVIAAHELAHALQPRWMHWLRIIGPFRWWYEVDAWRRAMEILRTVR